MTHFDFAAVENIIESGLGVFGDRLGSGLRVVSVEDPSGDSNRPVLGCGRQPSVEEALVQAGQDYLIRTQGMTDGPVTEMDQYLTGSSEITSRLDQVVLGGGRFRAFRNADGVRLQVFYSKPTKDVNYQSVHEDIVAESFSKALRVFEGLSAA